MGLYWSTESVVGWGVRETACQTSCLPLVERLGRVASISHVKGCGETGKIESRTATTFQPKLKGPGVRPGALEAGSWKLTGPHRAGLI